MIRPFPFSVADYAARLAPEPRPVDLTIATRPELADIGIAQTILDGLRG